MAQSDLVARLAAIPDLREVHTMIRIMQAARAVLAVAVLGIGTAIPAAAAIDSYGADLVLGMTSSTAQVNSGGSITFSLTINNTSFRQQICELDTDARDKPIRICYYETH